MENIIIVAILLVIVVGILWYLWKAKRRGEKCIGCPYSKQCGGNCTGGSVSDHAKKENRKNRS